LRGGIERMTDEEKNDLKSIEELEQKNGVFCAPHWMLTKKEG